MTSTSPRIAFLGASLCQTDPARQPGWPVPFMTKIQQRGMWGAIGAQLCRDGNTAWRMRYYGFQTGLPVPYGNQGTLGAKIIAFQPTDIFVGGDIAINAGIFNVDNQPMSQVEADTKQFLIDLKNAIPEVQFTYVRMIPPAIFTYAGQTYVTATANNCGWAAYDAILQGLMPGRMLTIDYNLVFGVLQKLGLLQSIDGIHEAYEVADIFAAMAYEGCPALYPDLESPNYPQFESITLLLNAIMTGPTDPNYEMGLSVLASLGFQVKP